LISEITMFLEIDSFDAKTKLPELLREVERGRRFTITLRGRAIADLVPTAGASRHDAVSAVARMQAFAPVRGVKDADVADWIAQGRR
jgi:antitoxin (DNA-binding transcriptional repressor) of toxin-antitoxin stability system